MLEGARRAGVGKVLATSSVAVLDAVEPTPSMDEDADLNPFLFYAITKAHSEGVVRVSTIDDSASIRE